MSAPVRAVVVPCAGRGTRLLPATLATAKELLPLGLHPALCAALLEADAAGVAEVVVVSAPGRGDLRRLLDPAAWPVPPMDPAVAPLAALLSRLHVRIVEQPAPVGALDAIERGLVAAGTPCAVLFPDLVHLPDQRALAELLGAYAAAPATIFGLYRAGAGDAALRGPSARVLLSDGEEARPGRPCCIARVEAPAGPPLPGELRTTFGAVHTAAFAAALETCARPAPGAPLDDGCLVAALDRLARAGQLNGVLLSGEVLDLGTAPGYLAAARRFAAGEAALRGL